MSESHNNNWRELPLLVSKLFTKYAEEAKQLVSKYPDDPWFWVIKDDKYGDMHLGLAYLKMQKNANEDPERGMLAPVGDVWRNIQKPISGINPITASLATGAMLAAVGYPTGWLLSRLMPNVFDRKAAKRLMTAGGLLGLLLPAPYWYEQIKQHGIKGIATKFPKGFEKTAEYNPFIGYLANNMDIAAADNVDTVRWMRMVGTDPYLTPPAKGLLGSMPIAASMANKGSRWVSPIDIGRIAVGAGWGGTLGLGLGRVAQIFTGLNDDSVKKLQNAGLLLGALKAMAPGITTV